LGRRAARVLSTATGGRRILVSAVSAWEVGVLAATGKIELRWPAAEFIERTAALPVVTFVPLSREVAFQATTLQPIHRDPADRFIIATALSLGVPVATSDSRFPKYAGLEVTW
jgi:PIN domain nuclease of toxin-antitoxin system